MNILDVYDSEDFLMYVMIHGYDFSQDHETCYYWLWEAGLAKVAFVERPRRLFREIRVDFVPGVEVIDRLGILKCGWTRSVYYCKSDVKAMDMCIAYALEKGQALGHEYEL